MSFKNFKIHFKNFDILQIIILIIKIRITLFQFYFLSFFILITKKKTKKKAFSSTCYRFWNQEVQKWEQKQKEMHHDEYSKKSNDSPRLMKVIFRTFWKKYLYTGLLLSIQYLILMVINPILVSWIISYFKIDENAKRMEKLEVVTYICYLLLSIIVIVCISHHVDLLTQQIGMRIRIACSSLIYRKV